MQGEARNPRNRGWGLGDDSAKKMAGEIGIASNPPTEISS